MNLSQRSENASPVRAFARADINQLVVRRSRDEIHEEFARVLGAGGMFVETPDPPPLGSEVIMEIGLPGLRQPAEIRAEVVWRRDPGSTELAGMGLRFVGVDGALRERLGDLVEFERSRVNSL